MRLFLRRDPLLRNPRPTPERPDEPDDYAAETPGRDARGRFKVGTLRAVSIAGSKRDAMDERHQSEAGRIVRDPAIESLARSFDIEAEEVQSLYESILTEMKREAIITDFLPIFVDTEGQR